MVIVVDDGSIFSYLFLYNLLIVFSGSNKRELLQQTKYQLLLHLQQIRIHNEHICLSVVKLSSFNYLTQHYDADYKNCMSNKKNTTRIIETILQKDYDYNH